MRKQLIELATLLSVLSFCGCNASVNEDLHVSANGGGSHGGVTLNGNVVVEKGAVVPGAEFSTVNGNIDIGEGAQVNSVRTVNGSIVMADDALAHDVQTVNGRFELGHKARVSGNVKLVNGGVSLLNGSQVGGGIDTVNGEIVAKGATIEGDIGNYVGGMLITEGSVVKGGITVHKPEEASNDTRPRIVIGPNSKILGRLKFESPVDLYVHDTAEIGPVDGAEAIRYSGAEPGTS